MDSQLLARVMVRDQPKLLAYANALVRDHHLADDVVQEVFAVALGKQDQFNDRDHLMAWCRETVRRKSLEMMRKAGRGRMVFDANLLDMMASEWEALDDESSSDVLEALRACMKRLSPNARRVIQARYQKGLTGQALADSIGKKFNTVYVALSRAHKSLGRCIERRLNRGTERE